MAKKKKPKQKIYHQSSKAFREKFGATRLQIGKATGVKIKVVGRRKKLSSMTNDQLKRYNAKLRTQLRKAGADVPTAGYTVDMEGKRHRQKFANGAQERKFLLKSIRNNELALENQTFENRTGMNLTTTSSYMEWIGRVRMVGIYSGNPVLVQNEIKPADVEKIWNWSATYDSSSMAHTIQTLSIYHNGTMYRLWVKDEYDTLCRDGMGKIQAEDVVVTLESYITRLTEEQ